MIKLIKMIVAFFNAFLRRSDSSWVSVADVRIYHKNKEVPFSFDNQKLIVIKVDKKRSRIKVRECAR